MKQFARLCGVPTWWRPQWSVNIPIFQRFGFANYWAVPSLLTDERPANEGLLQADVTFTAANLWTLASHRWFGYYTRAAYQAQVGAMRSWDSQIFL